jgi:hypothetical protein|tara:strand:- start:342 stop:590 length:249 start_codon:yes stop_codon:yes gene_type:complete
MIIEGLDKITFANGILRISTTKIGGSGQEESSGELLIPGPSVQLVLNGLIEAVKDISDKINPESSDNSSGKTDEKKGKNKKN